MLSCFSKFDSLGTIKTCNCKRKLRELLESKAGMADLDLLPAWTWAQIAAPAALKGAKLMKLKKQA